MEIIKTNIGGVVIIEPRIFQDGRGYFFESFARSKLVQAIKGAVLDVAVDIRKDSPTFGQYVSIELTGENHRQFFISRGFAHGFSVLSEGMISQYKCDNFYSPQSKGAIVWNDPDLNIGWRIPAEKVVLSEKGGRHSRLKDWQDAFQGITPIIYNSVLRIEINDNWERILERTHR